VSSYVAVFMTAPDKKEALEIARRLLNERLIARANIVGPVSSLSWWKGKIEKASEFLVIIKSRKDLFKKLCEGVKETHSYEAPEVIALPITERFTRLPRMDERFPSW